MEKLGREHAKLRLDLEGAGTRVDRVEREMDYRETKNPPKPCVKAADKMVEQDPVVKEQKKEQFFELSGEPQGGWGASGGALNGLRTPIAQLKELAACF